MNSVEYFYNCNSIINAFNAFDLLSHHKQQQLLRDIIHANDIRKYCAFEPLFLKLLEQQSIWLEACKSGNLSLIKYMSDNNQYEKFIRAQKFLETAINYGQPMLVQYFIDRGIRVSLSNCVNKKLLTSKTMSENAFILILEKILVAIQKQHFKLMQIKNLGFIEIHTWLYEYNISVFIQRCYQYANHHHFSNVNKFLDEFCAQ